MKKISLKLISLVLISSLLIGTIPASALNLIFHDRAKLPGLELPIDESLVIKNGILALEAEDMTVANNGVIVSEPGARGGLAVRANKTQWNVGSSPGPDLYTKIYVATEEEAGDYMLWMRQRSTGDSGSWHLKPNNEAWRTWYVTSTKDGNYYWNSVALKLQKGENYIDIRSRTTGYIDRIVITNNSAFQPEGMDDTPVYMTAEEQDAYALSLWAEPEIKPIEGHPRLLITNENKDKIKANLQGNWRYEQYVELANKPINCKLDQSLTNNHNANRLSEIMARSLMWVLGNETNPSYAKETIGHMKDYMATVIFPYDQRDITRSIGNVIYTAAIVYDWHYDELTDADKEWFYTKIRGFIDKMEIGWPPDKMSSVASHAGENDLFKNIIGVGIALYDEYPVVWDVAAGRIFEEMAPSRRFFRKAGRCEYGHDYSMARGVNEVHFDWMIMAMGYDSVFGEDIIKSAIDWRLYARMPHGYNIPDGDMYSLRFSRQRYYYVDAGNFIAFAAYLYNDPYLLQEHKRNLVTWEPGTHDGFYTMLMQASYPEVEKKMRDEMPLSKVATYPQSGFIAKTSWQEGYDSDAAMAFVDMHELYIGDHQMQYTGDFQIAYRGLLAQNTGVYNSSTQHNAGYSHRAIAANTMLVYDPDETFKAYWQPHTLKVPNDGGQRMPYDGGPYVLKLDEFEINSDGQATTENLIVCSDVKSYTGPNQKTPEFTYITGDLTNAYTDKVADYHRSCVFIDLDDDTYPAAFVVYDKIDTSDPDFKKVWLLHSQLEPTITGNTTIIERTDKGLGGRLVNKTLTPDISNQEINVVGGQNGEIFKNSVSDNAVSPADTVEQGNYRIELSPKKAAKSDTFLNAMFVTQAGNTQELPMKKINQGQFTGVSVKDKYVFFQKYAELVDQKFNLSLSNSEYDTVSIMIGGIKEGIWTVSSANKVQNIEVTQNSQVLMFKGAPGNYTISPAAEGTKADEITYPEMSKRKIGDFYVWHDDETSTSKAHGNYIFLEYPTQRTNGIAYIAANTLKNFGANVSVSGNTATIKGTGGTAVVTAGSAAYTIDGSPAQFTSVPYASNGTIYISPKELETVLGYTFTDRVYNDVLVAEKK